MARKPPPPSPVPLAAPLSPSSSGQAPLRALRPLVGYLRAAGRDTVGLLAAAGLDPLALLDPKACAPHPALMEVWRRAEAMCADPSIGLHVTAAIDWSPVERVQHETEWPIVQLAAISGTAGEALGRMARCFPLGFYGSRLLLDRIEGAVRARHVVPLARDVPRGFSECVLFLVVRLIRELSGRRAAPRCVRFSHGAPPSLDVHERLIQAPVEFSAGEDAVLFEEADLDAPLRSPNPRLAAELERQAEEALARLPPLDTLADQVRALLLGELRGGNPGADHVAELLGMSTRTLSRRLEELGTSHKVLLDEVRAGLARQHLASGQRTVAEISRLLGYSEVSAFHRAFKRWYGLSPNDFRRGAGVAQ